MNKVRHDRFIPLKNCWSYPGSEFIDQVVFLPSSEDVRRRVLLYGGSGQPGLRFDEVELRPQQVLEAPVRWVDYGIVELPFLRDYNWAGGYFSQLQVSGVRDVEDAILVVTHNLAYHPGGKHVDEVQRELCGISSAGAGATRLFPPKAVAGDAIEFDYEYTAGPGGLPAGATLRLVIPNVFPQPQTTDPAADGYFSDIAPSKKVDFEGVEPSSESHEMSDVFLRLTGALDPGETITLRYQCDRLPIFLTRFEYSDRKDWWERLPPLSTAVAVSDEHPFISLAHENSHRLEIVPGKVSRLHLFLPGRMAAGAPVAVRGVFTDHYRNTPPAGIYVPEFELWLEADGERQRLDEGIHFLDYFRFAVELGELPAGIYRVYARDRHTGEEIARSNPLEVMKPDDSRPNVYWGEIHAHSEMSDGTGKFTDLYCYARQDGCLDFASGCDHAVYFTDNQWKWMQDITNHWNQPGEFVTLVSYEWGGKQMHRNIYTARSHLEVVRGRMMPNKHVDELWRKYHGDDQIVGGPHGSIGHGLIFEKHDPDVERFIEIYSMWGASDFLDSPLSLLQSPAATNWSNPNVLSANQVLKTGARLGFTGGGDCHEARAGFSCEDPDGQGSTPHSFSRHLPFRCGMTAALMPELSRRALVQALRSRSTYATTGARLLLAFSIGDFGMGQAGRSEQVICRLEVHAVSSLSYLEIIRSGETVFTRESTDLDLEMEWEDPAPQAGEQYYYLHIVQNDGHEAWSSPIWVNR